MHHVAPFFPTSLLWQYYNERMQMMQALDAGMHHLILDIPGCAIRPEHAAHICAIMRHLLEDPATLQAAMEAEIRSALTQKASRTGGVLPSFPPDFFILFTLFGAVP